MTDDDLSDWLEYARKKVLPDHEWDVEFEVRTPDTLPHEVSEDDTEVVADKDGIRAWTHETGEWRVIKE